MRPESHITFLTIPNTTLINISPTPGFPATYFLEKNTDFEICPKCCVQSFSVYDRRTVKIKDAPIRNGQVLLIIRKRRFLCLTCKKPFTEPLGGVSKGARTTQRFQREMCAAAEKYSSLEQVSKDFHCSKGSVYKTVYKHLELKRRKRLYPWPQAIGIDEHSFKRDKKGHFTVWNTVIVDHINKKVFELAKGRSSPELRSSLSHLQGRENVKYVTMDLSATYKNFVKEFFTGAEIIADRFHVIRLFHDRIKASIREKFGTKTRPEISRSLHKKFQVLSAERQEALSSWLLAYPNLSRIHRAKEAIEGIYRVNKSYEYKRKKFIELLDDLSKYSCEIIKSLRQTLLKWCTEILASMRLKYSNGRVEGYNNKAKLIKRQGYGFQNFDNFRLKFLNACT